MRLLFLTPQLPYPPEQGAALRNWGIVAELAKRHEVHLLTFADERIDQPALASVTTVPLPARPASTRLRDLVLSREPDMARRLWSPAMAQALYSLLARLRPDIVQVEGIEMVPYALTHLHRSARPRFVYDAHNAESDLQASAFRADALNPRRLPQAFYSAVQAWKLSRYERQVLPRFDLICAVSEPDVEKLRRLSGVTPLLLPNGIDTDAVSPAGVTPPPNMKTRPGPRLLFTGKMDFRPNVDALLWFVESILPRISTERGAPTLWAVGQSPHAALAPLRQHPQVVLTGRVPAVEPYIAGADVVVVPLRMGSGTRLKVLQALSMEKAVVGTALGSAGLGLEGGEHLLLADDPAAFADAVSRLLAVPAESASLGRQGRQHVRRYFDWRVLVPLLEARLEELAAA